MPLGNGIYLKKVEPFSDVLLLKSKVFTDSRGLFLETFSKDYDFLGANWVQDNCSVSKKHVCRGLHFQKGEHAQAKLVRVLSGLALDIVIDLRRNSPTFSRWAKILLDGSSGCSVYVPRGFAHGFISLEDNTVFHYKVDNYYDKDSEAGINFFDDDKELLFDWLHMKQSGAILSEKDAKLPLFSELVNF